MIVHSLYSTDPYHPWMDIHMGGCQNYGPFLGTLNIRGRIIIGIQKGTMILTTTHIYMHIIFAFLWSLKVPQFRKTVPFQFEPCYTRAAI